MSKSKKMDPKELSLKQVWEPARLAKKFQLQQATVRAAAKRIGKNGKSSRSQVLVQAELLSFAEWLNMYYTKVGKQWKDEAGTLHNELDLYAKFNEE